MPSHKWSDLKALFDDTFLVSFNTELVKGDDEPLYLPANEQRPHHQVIFAHGYFASCLHEIAHWCIAGEQRRLLEDYGYWYEPDGRSANQQAEFEKVEVKPQALEWLFSQACDFRYHPSFDNLSGEETDTSDFKKAIHQQVLTYFETQCPPRAQMFIDACLAFYRPERPLNKSEFLAIK